jgi:acyl transferase domain-containing protein
MEPSTVPIAVIGMSFQLPDGATSAESLWSMIMEARCASTNFPADRLGGSAIYHPDPARGDSVRLGPRQNASTLMLSRYP